MKFTRLAAFAAVLLSIAGLSLPAHAAAGADGIDYGATTTTVLGAVSTSVASAYPVMLTVFGTLLAIGIVMRLIKRSTKA